MISVYTAFISLSIEGNTKKEIYLKTHKFLFGELSRLIIFSILQLIIVYTKICFKLQSHHYIVRYYRESPSQEAPPAYQRRDIQRSQGIGQLLRIPFLDGVRRAPTVPATAKRYPEEHENANKGHQKRLGHTSGTTIVCDSRKFLIYFVT